MEEVFEEPLECVQKIFENTPKKLEEVISDNILGTLKKRQGNLRETS